MGHSPAHRRERGGAPSPSHSKNNLSFLQKGGPRKESSQRTATALFLFNPLCGDFQLSPREFYLSLITHRRGRFGDVAGRVLSLLETAEVFSTGEVNGASVTISFWACYCRPGERSTLPRRPERRLTARSRRAVLSDECRTEPGACPLRRARHGWRALRRSVAAGRKDYSRSLRQTSLF